MNRNKQKKIHYSIFMLVILANLSSCTFQKKIERTKIGSFTIVHYDQPSSMSLIDSNPIEISSFLGPKFRVAHYDFSPDKKRFVFIKNELENGNWYQSVGIANAKNILIQKKVEPQEMRWITDVKWQNEESAILSNTNLYSEQITEEQLKLRH